jgi:hypothetical protein
VFIENTALIIYFTDYTIFALILQHTTFENQARSKAVAPPAEVSRLVAIAKPRP